MGSTQCARDGARGVTANRLHRCIMIARTRDNKHRGQRTQTAEAASRNHDGAASADRARATCTGERDGDAGHDETRPPASTACWAALIPARDGLTLAVLGDHLLKFVLGKFQEQL